MGLRARRRLLQTVKGHVAVPSPAALAQVGPPLEDDASGGHWWGDERDFRVLTEAYNELRDFVESRWPSSELVPQ